MSTNIIEAHEANTNERLVMLITTQSCNCACRYCYESHKSAATMSVETAKNILSHEFNTAAARGITRLNIDFMGGEPLLHFKLIQEVCEWLWSKEWPLPYSTMARTNGLLLSEEKRNWFTANRHHFFLGLSMDGLPDMQRINRSSDIPDARFFLKNWPGQPIKMTLFPDSIHLFAQSVIDFHEKNIPFTASLGEGFPWGKEAEVEFERQLEQLVDFYITHPNHPPVSPLLQNRYLCCFPNDETREYSSTICWDSRRIATYDCDGKEYRCHMFSPISMGRKQAERALDEITRQACQTMDSHCIECPARLVCKRCFGLDYKLFGNLQQSVNRLYLCRLQRSCLKASADIYLGRLAAIQQQRSLTPEELREGLQALKVSDAFTNPDSLPRL